MTAAGTSGARAAPCSFKHWLVHEFKRFVWIFLYLWILFGLFVLNERIILGQHGVNFTSQGFALVNALVLAKVMLVAEDLRLGGRFGHFPLALSVAIDSALFATLFLVFHVLEKMVVGLIQGKSAEASVPTIGQGGLPGAITAAIILFFSLLPYFMFTSLGRIIGPGRLRGFLLKSPAALQNELAKI